MVKWYPWETTNLSEVYRTMHSCVTHVKLRGGSGMQGCTVRVRSYLAVTLQFVANYRSGVKVIGHILIHFRIIYPYLTILKSIRNYKLESPNKRISSSNYFILLNKLYKIFFSDLLFFMVNFVSYIFISKKL